MIYDCFTYFNDELITDLRLNTLDEYVDKFVIVEANLDHAGKPKKLNFDIKKFQKFKNKIRYIVVTDLPKETNSFYFNRRHWHKNMVRDEYQRNQIMRGINDAKDEDLIIISDNNEIPNLKNIYNIKFKRYAVFNQKFYKYKFNLLSPNQTPYQGSRVIIKKFLKGNITPQWLRYKYTKRIKFWQVHRYFTNPFVIEDGGWHFSFIQTPEKIRSKILAYGHGEFNNDKFTNLEYIKNRINSNKELFSDTDLEKVELDETFPKYLIHNKEKFKDFLI